MYLYKPNVFKIVSKAECINYDSDTLHIWNEWQRHIIIMINYTLKMSIFHELCWQTHDCAYAWFAGVIDSVNLNICRSKAR